MHLKNTGMEQTFSNAGEMGKLTCEKDWTNTSLGPMQDWPQSLKISLGILLNSKFPMFLYWGPELLCFYNERVELTLA